MHLFFATLPRRYKIAIMLLSDIVLLPAALWSAIALRYGTFTPDTSTYAWLFLVLPLFTIPLLAQMGLYRAIIRYVDEKIIKTVIQGVSISVLILIAVMAMTQIQGLPRSSVIIYWFMSCLYIAASRYLARSILRTLERKERRKQNVAIYGAGSAGLQTALALMSGTEYKPVLFFDDNEELQGATLAGIRVYSPTNAELIMDKHSCFQLLLAVPSASRQKRKEIIRRFESKNIQLKTIPGMGEILGGKLKIDDIREVGIEDLLGRDPVPPFEDLISACIKDKSVLVTGAGGSIGSELCRQIMSCGPKLIVLFERSEYYLYKLDMELRKNFKDIQIISVLGDVTHQQQLESVLSQYSIETIYHAAAYKHVPLVEANVIAGTQNNVFGTFAAAQAAINKKVKNFVLISTDKAVRPTNIMGATKRMAEMILQALADTTTQTRFCMVRFGNVLGSSGSVVPLFKEQIKNGGPITVTHPEVTRYFMTIPEAAQLVLQAGAMGVGGEVFVLDMGEPIKITDLAKNMIELSGFEVKDATTGEGDISIEYVGLRPGEKLYEELLIGNNVQQTKHPRIMKAGENFLKFKELIASLEQLKIHCEKLDVDSTIKIIQDVVKDYKQVQK